MIYVDEAQIFISSPELSPEFKTNISNNIFNTSVDTTNSKWPNLVLHHSFLAWWTHFSFDMTNIVKFKKAGMPAFENLRQMNHNRFPLGSYSFVNKSNKIYKILETTLQKGHYISE